MLSYRHSYHAGNHADVLKHIVEIAVLDYLIEKDKPLTYIDTHSAQGLYALQGDHASKNKEHLEGVAKIDHSQHELLSRYATFSDANWYAGSVNIAQQILREDDKLRCFELHPNDYSMLCRNTQGDKRVKCFDSDGFKGLIAQVPPQTKRAAVMIDPSYELDSDYKQVINTLKGALQRFAVGVYMVWYPLLSKIEVQRFQKQLEKLSAAGQPVKFLHAQLQVRKPSPGMYGSGMFIINPPWKLKNQLQEILPQLVKQLGEPGKGASFSLSTSKGL